MRTAAFQATKPRGNIYVVESLLPRCIGNFLTWITTNLVVLYLGGRQHDFLAPLQDAPVCFVLRAVEDDKNEPMGAQKHRIVARAAIDKKALNIP